MPARQTATKTIRVHLTDEMASNLRARLAASDADLSEFIQRALAEQLRRDGEADPSAYELWKQYFKGWESGETDRAERMELILRAEFDDSRRR